MESAAIVDIVHSPLDRRNRALKEPHPVDLAATGRRSIVERNDQDPASIDDERTGGRYGMQTMCVGAGMANATIIESLG